MDKEVKDQAQEKLSQAVMQALIRVSALERVCFQKNLFTETEFAEALAYVVSDVAKTAKEVLGIDIKQESGK